MSAIGAGKVKTTWLAPHPAVGRKCALAGMMAARAQVLRLLILAIAAISSAFGLKIAPALWVLLIVLVVRDIWIENREEDRSGGGCEARWFKTRDSRASLGHNAIRGSKYRKSG